VALSQPGSKSGRARIWLRAARNAVCRGHRAGSGRRHRRPERVNRPGSERRRRRKVPATRARRVMPPSATVGRGQVAREDRDDEPGGVPAPASSPAAPSSAPASSSSSTPTSSVSAGSRAPGSPWADASPDSSSAPHAASSNAIAADTRRARPMGSPCLVSTIARHAARTSPCAQPTVALAGSEPARRVSRSRTPPSLPSHTLPIPS